MEKKINYLSRTFADIKDELIKFSNQYYPEVADDFTDSSIGAWFIDLVSAVGDDLSYHTDRMYQETNINSANLRSTILNLARTNGVKVPGAKCSICEVELSCVLPIDGDTTRTDGSITVSKSTIAINGTTKVYKKVLSAADVKPFMEVVLPETNVTNVESIIFKETSDITKSPEIYEYFIDAEEYRLSSDAVMTYRYFEVDSLADQYRFGMVGSYNGDGSQRVISNIYNPHMYDDYTETTKGGTTRSTRYYRGEWMSLTQKFITEYTDNGYLKIIFGASNGYGAIPKYQTTYGDYIASNLINNDMLGVLPKEGWSMYVLYRVGGGATLQDHRRG